MSILITRTIPVPSITVKDIGTFVSTAQLHKGQFGTTLVTVTDEHRLQKRQLYAMIGGKPEVRKISEVTNAMFGWDYERVVKNRIAREGGDPSTFESVAPTGKNWMSGLYGIVLQKTVDPSIVYLRSYQCKATKYRVAYMVDGHIATSSEDAIIRQCLRAPTPSHKQHEAGIEEENEVMPRDYGIDNIFGMFNVKWGIQFGLSFDNLVASI